MKKNNLNDKLLNDTNFSNEYNKSVEVTKLEKNSADIEYFSIPLNKLVILSVFTMGIYEIYWFYKNWEAIRKGEQQEISPFWRAWFAVFYCYSLFKKILQSAKKHDYSNPYSAGLLATIYIVLLVIGNGLGRLEGADFGLNILWLLIASSTFIPLLAIQKAINFNNSKIVQNYNNSRKFSRGEIIVIIFGIIFFGLTLLGILSYLVPNDYNLSSDKTIEEKVVNYFTDTSAWKEFNSPIGQFRAEFPTYPNHETESIEVPNTQLTLKYDSYTSEEVNGTIYIIGFTTYGFEIDTSNPENNLEDALNGMLISTQGNKLVSSNLTYFDGYRALDFLVQNNTIFLKGRGIMVGQTLYQLMVGYESKNYSENNYNKFINSFTILRSNK